MNPQDTNQISNQNITDPLLILDKPMPPIDDVNKSTNKYIKDYLKNNKSIALTLLFGFMFLGLLSFSVFGFFGPVFAVILVSSVAYARIKSRVKRQFTKQFGESIGFTYSDFAGLDSVGSKLFSTGHSQRMFDVLTGIHDGFPMRIFSYQFTIGSGKNSHTYVYTVFEVTLNSNVPNIILYSNSHDSAATDYFSGNDTIKLEGDFNKYFKLRVPKEYEMEAYQIFTPNVMADLIDKAKHCSFEFVGNRLYIYAIEMITTREKMDEMFSLVTYLDDLFRRNARGVDM